MSESGGEVCPQKWKECMRLLECTDSDGRGESEREETEMESVICQPSQTGGGGWPKRHVSYEWLSRHSPQPG